MSAALAPDGDGLDDDARYPTLTEAGRRMLQRLREHPAAPIYRNQSGNRLTAADLDALRKFEQATLSAPVRSTPDGEPEWLQAFVEQTFSEVPHFRALGPPPPSFEELPTTSRADLAADIARFVPDAVPIDRLINFRTTGTTGHPLLIASHPQVAARYLVFHKRALKRFGIELRHGRDQVGVVLLGMQQRCFTYVSVTPQMDESGLAKINLHPDDWRDPADRARYLDALEPEVVAGDPISFTTLLDLPVTLRPRALVSVSMALSPALRERLEHRFRCPVLDIYSMNEVGPIAVFDARAGGHVLLQPRLHVEILDPQGRALPPGERGEIVVSGGFNFCLPLLRYRTGDFGALSFEGEVPVIRGLSGRRPLRYRNVQGAWFNNIDISHALARVPMSRYAFHQAADGELQLSLAPGELDLADDACAALQPLFGAQPIAVAVLQAQDKVLQYSSALVGAEAT
ncbi:capsule biosynthesis protein CapK [Panacagrimonas perspica]|uniref:AMP-binding protein n=1 Tax=Panacagrimonas perspica TaxID=381431 RepID=UPI00113D3D25|nr:AMP-binding protein [Panacagrimonas perspica]THD05264.1 capsule biosynthesis protein CapK [Panacagrimonas perspica]